MAKVEGHAIQDGRPARGLHRQRVLPGLAVPEIAANLP